MKMKNLKIKKIDVGTAISNRVKKTSSELVTTKIKSTMKTRALDDDMKNIKFSTFSIESFEFWLNRFCFGRGENPFRSTFNYSHSVKKAFNILKLGDKEIAGIKKLIDVKILMVHLQDKLRYSTDQNEAYGIICAFSKYAEFVKWCQGNDRDASAPILVKLPEPPKSPAVGNIAA
jgi:hypothetical protein